MKRLREILGEMKWQNLPKADDSDIEDRTKLPRPVFKAGDKWASGLWKRMGSKTVTQKQADDINSGRMSGGSPFPDSWDKRTQYADNTPSSPDTTINLPKKKFDATVPLPKTEPKIRTADNTPPAPKPAPAPEQKQEAPKKMSPYDPSTWPKGVDMGKTSWATIIDAGKPYNQAERDKYYDSLLKKADEYVAAKKRELNAPEPTQTRKAPASTEDRRYMTSVKPNDALPPDTSGKPQRNWTNKQLDDLFK